MTQLTASFRDPEGVCCSLDGRILRLVSGEKVTSFESFLKSPVAVDIAARRQLPSTRRLADVEVDALRSEPKLHSFFVGKERHAVFEHEKIFFPSYPYE